MDARTRRRLGVGLLAAAALFGPGLVEWVRLDWRQRRLDRELAALQARHAALKAEHERLQTDPVYVEGLIRSTFKHAKPNELVIPLQDNTDSPSVR